MDRITNTHSGDTLAGVFAVMYYADWFGEITNVVLIILGIVSLAVSIILKFSKYKKSQQELKNSQIEGKILERKMENGKT